LSEENPVEFDDKEPAIAPINYMVAVATGLYNLPRPGLPIDHHYIPKKLGESSWPTAWELLFR